MRRAVPATTRTRSRPAGRRSGPTSGPGRSPIPASPASTPRSRRPTCSRCSRTPRASPTSATSRTTRSATRSPTSAAARASRWSTRWATTPSACPPRTTRSRPGEHPRDATWASIDAFRARVPPLGRLDRLVARDRHLRPRLLPLDPVDLPAAVRARARLPRRGAGPVVPQRPDRARQRAGDRRPLRALRLAGRAARPRAVVLPDHRLRRPAARRLRRCSSPGPSTW